MSLNLEPRSEQPTNAEIGGIVSSRPAIVIGLGFLCLALLAWPAILGKFISLDWKLGNLRPVAYAMCALLVACGVVFVSARRWISARYAEAFPSNKHLAFALITMLVSVAFTFLAAEIVLRVADQPFKKRWNFLWGDVMQFEPDCGWSHFPNRSVPRKVGSNEVPQYFDQMGSRVGGPAERHDPAVPTVMFVGDSFTFGQGLAYEDTFVGKIGLELAPALQTVNLGVTGYGTDQSLLTLKRDLKKFNTKIVVYTFIYNHVDRNSVNDWRLFHPSTRVVGTKPMFALKRDGVLYLKDRAVPVDDYSYSRVWACLQIAATRWGPKPGLDVTRALVREMKVYSEANGAKFVIVYWDQGHSWDGGPRYLMPGGSPFSGMDLDVIDAGASPPSGWSDWIIPVDNHPDARAHSYVAQIVSRELQRIMKETRPAESAVIGTAQDRKRIILNRERMPVQRGDPLN